MEVDVSIHESVEERMILKEMEHVVLQGVGARGTELKKGHHGSWKRRVREGKPVDTQGDDNNKENLSHKGLMRGRVYCEKTKVQAQENLAIKNSKYPKLEGSPHSPMVEVGSQNWARVYK